MPVSDWVSEEVGGRRKTRIENYVEKSENKLTKI